MLSVAPAVCGSAGSAVSSRAFPPLCGPVTWDNAVREISHDAASLSHNHSHDAAFSVTQSLSTVSTAGVALGQPKSFGPAGIAREHSWFHTYV